ncbi:hypothetical protein JTL53_34150, partial [Pseudomonas aeruginosa]|nr:hypothetical protein [Pseudomonas aeruginosa]MBN0182141.1 hypothetical protein [Pseudomonas aeruginosa]
HHFHTDHPVFSCSKIEQKQLNTWVSFQSAEQPLLGQFSVSGNSNTPNLGDFVRPKFGRTKHRLTTNFVRSQKDVLRTFEAGFSNAGYSRICA